MMCFITTNLTNYPPVCTQSYYLSWTSTLILPCNYWYLPIFLSLLKIIIDTSEFCQTPMINNGIHQVPVRISVLFTARTALQTMLFLRLKNTRNCLISYISWVCVNHFVLSSNYTFCKIGDRLINMKEPCLVRCKDVLHKYLS